MSDKICRIIYRPEWNLHLGHLPTLYYNNQWALENNGTCYLILDDIYRPEEYLRHFREDLAWLNFSHIVIKPLSEYLNQIVETTQQLIRSGHVLVESRIRGVCQRYCDPKISETIFKDIIVNESNESYHVKFVSSDSDVSTIFRSCREQKNWTMDYMISVIDYLLGVTHIINLSKMDILNLQISKKLCDALGCQIPEIVNKKPFRISDLRYQKTSLDEMIQNKSIESWDDPRLLTLSGLRNRGYPAELLHRFCHMGYQMSVVGVSQLDHLLLNKYNQEAPRRFVILNPVTVKVTNWDPKVVKYVSKPDDPCSPWSYYLVPQNGQILLDRGDSTLGEVLLKYSGLLTFTNTDVDHPEATYSQTTVKDRALVHWMSYGICEEPQKAEFHMFKGYYTGNHHCNLGHRVKTGLIESDAVFVPGQIYNFERVGYFHCKSPGVFYQLATAPPRY